MSRLLNIGEAAEAADVSAKMIRHHEQIGLVPPATRTDAGHRQDTERDVSILRFIRQSRRLGFSTEPIADLPGLWSNRRRASREVKALAQRLLEALEDKMRERAGMQQALAVSSPDAPEPGAVGAKPFRKGRTRSKEPHATESVPTRTHWDLMAWTRNIHVDHGHL